MDAHLLDSILQNPATQRNGTMEYALLSAITQAVPYINDIGLMRLDTSDESAVLIKPWLHLSITLDEQGQSTHYRWKSSDVHSPVLDHFIRQSIGQLQQVRQYEERGRFRTLFPIRVQQALSAVLYVNSYRCLDSSLDVIQGMLTLYQHYAVLQMQSQHDYLTGFFSQSMLQQNINQLLQQQHQNKVQNAMLRSEQGYCRRGLQSDAVSWLAIMDVDLAGESYLTCHLSLLEADMVVAIAHLLQCCFRDNDLLFRLQDGRFVVVLEPTTFLMASRVLERVRETMEQIQLDGLDSLSVSIGFAQLDAMQSMSEVLKHADKALYYSKQQGGNLVHNYESLLGQGILSQHIAVSTMDLFE